MIIEKIVLNNFRQFKGLQEIEFLTDGDKNVTIILGDNTSGKSTIVQAFDWCLFEKTNFKDKNVANIDEVNGGMIFVDVFVQVELRHNGSHYTIKRSQSVRRGEKSNGRSLLTIFVKDSNGESREIDDREVENKIASILPNTLSEYFFLAGETIGSINSNNNVKNAVRRLMGVDAISNAVDHFSPNKQTSVINKLHNSLDVKAGNDGERLKSQLEKLRTDRDGMTDLEADYRLSLKELKLQKEQKEQMLLDNQHVAQLQKQRIGLEKDLGNAQERFESSQRRFVKDFCTNGFKFFASPLFEKATKVVNSSGEYGEGIPDMHGAALEYILTTRKKCICGCDLTNNEQAVNAIKKEQSLLPPMHIGTIVRLFCERCQRFATDSQSYVDVLSQSYTDIVNAQNEIDDKQEQLKELSNKLEGNIDVSKIESELKKIKEQIVYTETNITEIVRKSGEKEADIKNITKYLDNLLVSSEKNKRIKLLLAYAEALSKEFLKDYEDSKAQVLSSLNSSISHAFEQMYHGKRVVEVDENYKITLKASDHSGKYAVDNSSGLDAVKNFAFLAGLIDLVRKKVRDEVVQDVELQNTNSYPLVLDAPFSDTDEKHIQAIAKLLPNIAEQVIFVIMDKDYIHAKDALQDKIDRVYHIQKLSETSSQIRRA